MDYADDPEQEVENVLAGLPTRVEIPQDVADEYYQADSDYDSEIITDYLSDTYGWLVYGCDIEFLESYGRKSKKSIKESHRRKNRKPLREEYTFDRKVEMWFTDLAEEFLNNYYHGLDSYFDSETPIDTNSRDYQLAKDEFIEWLVTNPRVIHEAENGFEKALDYYVRVLA